MEKRHYCISVLFGILIVCIFSTFIKTQALAVEFSEDFELGIGDWYANNGVWEVGAPSAGPESCHSGTQCAGTVLNGDYPFDTDSHFVSPTILLPDVTGTDEIHLRFWHWFSYYHGSYTIDFGQVTISEYNASNEPNPWSNFEVVRIVAQDTSASSWTLTDVELTAYASKRVRIGFHHSADNSAPYAGTGWYVDDIEISSPQGIWVVDFDADGDGVPDSSDQCPETLEGACVDNVGCSSEGSYTQEQVDQIVSNILTWGDTDGDGKIGLVEAINALKVVSGGE